MPNPKPPYPAEFRSEAVRLAKTGEKSLTQLSRDLGVSLESLRKWIAREEIETGERDGLTASEREELRVLRRENRQLREEREILKKAAAFFAQETSRNRQ